MENLKDIRTRIASVTSTMKITNAMKMVSAAKLRKAQNAILDLRPYANKINEILEHIINNLENYDYNAFSEKREEGKLLFVVISSNRGLCGAFNTNIIKATIGRIEECIDIHNQADKVDLITIGKKGSDYFRKHNFNLLNSYDDVYDNLEFNNISPICDYIMNEYTNTTYKRIEIIYNQFKNAAVQILKREQFLPLELMLDKGEKEESSATYIDYIYEPSKHNIVTELIPKVLKIQFYRFLLDSHAAEHGARMTAMHKATDNAEEILHELRLSYNKARQSNITNEILEIVGGAQALNK